MSLPRRIRRALLHRFLGGMRFPRLFLLTAFVFAVDLVVPDPLPLVDEVLLGLVSLLLASLREGKTGTDRSEEGKEGTGGR